MASKKNQNPTAPAAPSAPPAYDPAAGKAALESLAPKLNALRPDELSTTRTDIESGALAALAVYAFAMEPSRHARFLKLHDAEEFDIAHLHGLKDLCFAVLFARSAAKHDRSLASDAKLSAALLSEALTVERRMQSLCEYHLSDDPAINQELALLRPGSGHNDLAYDLLGYADLYEKHAAIITLDPKHYRATDIADARRIAGEILSALSKALSPKERDAQEQLARSWTLLHRAYVEVRETGLFLLRRDPQKDLLFPSLFTVGRQSARSKKDVSEADGESAGGEKTP